MLAGNRKVWLRLATPAFGVPPMAPLSSPSAANALVKKLLKPALPPLVLIELVARLRTTK